LVNQHLSIS